jgi:hypothetical protein
MSEKVCCRCKTKKVLTEYNKNKSEKDGFHRVCKECRKIERKERREEIINKNKNYYRQNKEVLLEKNKKYRLDNLDTIKVQKKEYRERNIEHIKKKNKEYNPIRLEKIKERRRKDINYRVHKAYRAKFFRVLKGIILL